MGNHTDQLGNRPNFKNSVHTNLAKGLGARFGRFDSVWSGGGSCDTVTPTDDDTLEDLAYSDCNAPCAGLVKWWSRAKSPEKRFKTVPTVASSQAGKRQKELRKNEDWRHEYARQRDEYRAGRPTEFPAGSYFLTTIYGAPTDTVDTKPP